MPERARVWQAHMWVGTGRNSTVAGAGRAVSMPKQFQPMTNPIVMKNNKSWLGLIILSGLALSAEVSPAAPQAKAYQVTGPVVEVTDTSITVKKGEENWQIARDAGTKISGDLKVGAKVTVQYRMVATDVEVKADKAGKPAAAEPAKPKKSEKQ